MEGLSAAPRRASSALDPCPLLRPGGLRCGRHSPIGWSREWLAPPSLGAGSDVPQIGQSSGSGAAAGGGLDRKRGGSCKGEGGGVGLGWGGVTGVGYRAYWDEGVATQMWEDQAVTRMDSLAAEYLKLSVRHVVCEPCLFVASRRRSSAQEGSGGAGPSLPRRTAGVAGGRAAARSETGAPPGAGPGSGPGGGGESPWSAPATLLGGHLCVWSDAGGPGSPGPESSAGRRPPAGGHRRRCRRLVARLPILARRSLRVRGPRLVRAVEAGCGGVRSD